MTKVAKHSLSSSMSSLAGATETFFCVETRRELLSMSHMLKLNKKNVDGDWAGWTISTARKCADGSFESQRMFGLEVTGTIPLSYAWTRLLRWSLSILFVFLSFFSDGIQPYFPFSHPIWMRFSRSVLLLTALRMKVTHRKTVAIDTPLIQPNTPVLWVLFKRNFRFAVTNKPTNIIYQKFCCCVFIWSYQRTKCQRCVLRVVQRYQWQERNTTALFV